MEHSEIPADISPDQLRTLFAQKVAGRKMPPALPPIPQPLGQVPDSPQPGKAPGEISPARASDRTRPRPELIRASATPAPLVCAACGEERRYRLDHERNQISPAREAARETLERLGALLPSLSAGLLWYRRDPCPCEIKRAARIASERQEEDRRAFGARVATVRAASRLSGWQASASFADFDPAFDSSGGMGGISVLMREWAETFTPGDGSRGFVLQGVAGPQGPGIGCGKTLLAAATANLLLSRGIGAIFVTMGDLLASIREEFSGATPAGTALRAAVLVPVLFLDDLGAERIPTGEKGDWSREQIYRLLNARDSARRPLVCTTNLSRERIEAHIGGEAGGRCLSRIYALADWYTVSGPDCRRA